MSDLGDIITRYRGRPVKFIRELILKANQAINPEQLKVITDFEELKRQFVKAGHGVGKTTMEAWLSLYFLCCFPYSLIPVTAPTLHQLTDVYAAEVKRWYSQSKLADLGLLKFKANQISINDDRIADTWAIKLQASSVPENLQGFHAKYIFFIVDEASGVQQKTLEVVEGALTSENSYFLACGNPTKNSGMFFDAFGKYKDDNNLKTISCEAIDSPGMRTYCEKLAKKYGKTSNVYLIRAKGEFGRTANDAIFSPYIVENALNTKGILTRKIVLGIDPGAGGDLSVIFMRCGNQITGLYEFNYSDTTLLVDEIVKICRQNMGFDVHINIDSTGLGKPIFDSLAKKVREKEMYCTICPVNFAMSPKDGLQYADKPTELYFEARNKLMAGNIGILDNESGDLFAQLTARPFHLTGDNRMQIQDKKSFIKDFTLSPNHADAFVLCMTDPLIVSCAGAAA